MKIGNYDVPEPLREAPELPGKYYIANPMMPDYYDSVYWSYRPWQEACLQRGLVHLTSEDAALHGKALAELSEEE